MKWPYATGDKGEAVVTFGGRQVSASRLMCTWVHGDPPDPSLDSAHDCGRGHEGCVNGRHLRWDTRAGNLADMMAHGTAVLGEARHNAKLTRDDVREIRRLLSTMSQHSVAKRFSVSVATINLIHLRKNWRWLD